MVYNTEGRISSEDLHNLCHRITNLTKGSDKVVDNDKSDLDNLCNQKTSLGSKDDKSYWYFDHIHNGKTSLESKDSGRVVSDNEPDLDNPYDGVEKHSSGDDNTVTSC